MPNPSDETDTSATPFSLTVENSFERGGRSRAFVYAAVIAALVLSVAAIGFPRAGTASVRTHGDRPGGSGARPNRRPKRASEAAKIATRVFATQPEGGAETPSAAPDGANTFAIPSSRSASAKRAKHAAAQERANAQAAKPLTPQPGRRPTPPK